MHREHAQGGIPLQYGLILLPVVPSRGNGTPTTFLRPVFDITSRPHFGRQQGLQIGSFLVTLDIAKTRQDKTRQDKRRHPGPQKSFFGTHASLKIIKFILFCCLMSSFRMANPISGSFLINVFKLLLLTRVRQV